MDTVTIIAVGALAWLLLKPAAAAATSSSKPQSAGGGSSGGGAGNSAGAPQSSGNGFSLADLFNLTSPSNPANAVYTENAAPSTDLLPTQTIGDYVIPPVVSSWGNTDTSGSTDTSATDVNTDNDPSAWSDSGGSGSDQYSDGDE